MIKIGKPFVETVGEFSYLKAKIDISDDTVAAWQHLEKVLPKTHWRFYDNFPPVEWKEDGCLWFQVNKDYEKYLCYDRADAFIVAFIYYAMMTSSDIQSEAPVSEKMLFSIRNFLLPALLTKDLNDHSVNIIAPEINEAFCCKNEVATGMSCGVDSLYSLQKYSAENIPDNYKLTYLTYFNMGAIFHPSTAENTRYSMEDFYRITDEMSDEKIKNAQLVADKVGLSLLAIKSNLDKDYYRGAYGYTGVYRNCAMALAVQGLIGKYYCSSAGWPEFFDPKLTEGSEHYETLLCNVFSTESLEFIISDFDTRITKTISIADYEISKIALDVCFNFNNCGSCSKCYRTLITLDLLDKLDDYYGVFDVDKYKQNRVEAYAWLIETKNGDQYDDNVVFAKDIYDLAVQKGKLPKEAFKLYKRIHNKKRIEAGIDLIKTIVRRIIK